MVKNRKGPPYYCYIIENSSGKTYNGYTNNLLRRLKQHNGEIKGGAKYTRGKGPWYFIFVVYCDKLKTVSDIMKLEWSIKYPTRRKGRKSSYYHGGIMRINSLSSVFSQDWLLTDYDETIPKHILKYYVCSKYEHECEVSFLNCRAIRENKYHREKIEKNEFVNKYLNNTNLDNKKLKDLTPLSTNNDNTTMSQTPTTPTIPTMSQNLSINIVEDWLTQHETSISNSDSNVIRLFRRILKKLRKIPQGNNDVMTLFLVNSDEVVKELFKDTSITYKITTYDTLHKALKYMDVIKNRMDEVDYNTVMTRYNEKKKQYQNENYKKKKHVRQQQTISEDQEDNYEDDSETPEETPEETDNNEYRGGDNEWDVTSSREYTELYKEWEKLSDRLEELENDHEIALNKLNKIFKILPLLEIDENKINIIKVAIE